MNRELLTRAIQYIKAHPEEWDQRSFEDPSARRGCGTAFCLAHHVCEEAGERPTVNIYDIDVLYGEAYENTVPGMAERLLEISDEQGTWLFDSNRTLADFDRVAVTGHCPTYLDYETEGE